MRVITIISKEGDSWCLAQRIKEEGHRAIVYINSEERRRIGNGFVEKSAEQRVLINEGKLDEEALKGVLYPKPDCVIMDMVGEGFGVLADRLRAEGIPVMGCCAWADKIELDRPYGLKAMKAVGINTPITHKFTDYKEAIKFVEATNKPYVYKPSGNQCTTTTYVAQSASDLIGMLEYYSDINEEFELQEKIEGIEISSEVWFNGEVVLNVNHTMEEKPLLEGGRGPKAGCMGSVVWLGNENTQLYKEGIGRMIPALKKIGYRGPLDLNTIVTQDKLYGLEFTARFGYDALYILLEMYKGRVGDLMYGIATGVLKKMDFRAEWGIGVALVVPPYPLPCDPDLYKDILIQGVGQENQRHIWLYDAYKSGERLLCGGCGGDVMDITARGDKIDSWSPLRDAKRRVMRTISNLIIPDVMFRRDIGDRVPGDYGQLKKWGWI
jgi:phosphoribosylamine--glycine ligase